jgi:hypothetical protein
MSVEKVEADFWSALSLLLRPNDDKHNAAMISDFSKMSQIPESIVREKLNKSVRSKELH